MNEDKHSSNVCDISLPVSIFLIKFFLFVLLS